MRYAIPTCAVAALLVAAPVLAADEPAKAETPTWTVTSNIALTNAYFFRGLNYTRERPAVQGGFDISHSSGFYVGTWASNVDGNAFPNANVEIDLYGGYARQFGDFLVDVGVLQFLYPGEKGQSRGLRSFNTTELYAGVTWQWLNLKYSHAASTFFGIPGTEGSGYVELNANYEVLPSWVLNGHVGHQNVDGVSACSYTDYRAGVTKNFEGGWQLSAAGIAVDTVQDKACFVDYALTASKSTMDLNYQVMLKRTF